MEISTIPETYMVKYRLFHVLPKWQKLTPFFVIFTKFAQLGTHAKKYVQV
jgi:hypothetical protein